MNFIVALCSSASTFHIAPESAFRPARGAKKTRKSEFELQRFAVNNLGAHKLKARSVRLATNAHNSSESHERRTNEAEDEEARRE